MFELAIIKSAIEDQISFVVVLELLLREGVYQIELNALVRRWVLLELLCGLQLFQFRNKRFLGLFLALFLL
jgi:hypothetical protein